MTSETAKLIAGGTLLTCDPAVASLLEGDLLIEEDRITAIGYGLTRPNDAEVIDARGKIIFPGLVDAHQHVWEAPYSLQRPDMSIGEYFAKFVPTAAAAVTPDGLYLSSLELFATSMRSGTTTLFDWCHVTNSIDHATAALSALHDSGIRGVFGYGPPVALGYYGSDREHPGDLEAFVAKHGPQPSPLVGVAAALRGPDLAPLHVTSRDIMRARALELKVSMHIGTHRIGAGGVTALHESDLLGPDLQFVHATDCTDDEFALIQRSGGRIVVPPIAELSMGTGRPPLTRLAARGQSFGLAVDTALGGPQDVFGQMRAALLLLRWADWDGYDAPPASTCSDVLAAATLGGARSCWLEDEIGSLTPGKFADVVIMEPSRPVSTLAEAYGQVVWNGDASRIVSVMIAGAEKR
jgi:5-methylthioadenosine/S-adenosylhomocysteine deaminase